MDSSVLIRRLDPALDTRAEAPQSPTEIAATVNNSIRKKTFSLTFRLNLYLNSFQPYPFLPTRNTTHCYKSLYLRHWFGSWRDLLKSPVTQSISQMAKHNQDCISNVRDYSHKKRCFLEWFKLSIVLRLFPLSLPHLLALLPCLEHATPVSSVSNVLYLLLAITDGPMKHCTVCTGQKFSIPVFCSRLTAPAPQFAYMW